MRFHSSWAAAVIAVHAAMGCSNEATKSTNEHEVYFVGYAYNGATGARLSKAQITAISVKYRDQIIDTVIEDDGRFVTAKPLPTWQDYAVYIGAPGFRPFVSRNPGIDVPASLAMTDALAGTKTVQTFQVEASLFPLDLKAPNVTLTIDQSDAFTTVPPPPRAVGSIRLKPQSPSVLEASPQQATTVNVRRRWSNDEDLLTQTITKPFADGKAEILAGELLYGVPYQITVFGVPDYQPLVAADALVAGQVSSRTLVLTKEQQDPLRVVLIDADACVPPAGNFADYGAAIDIDFNAPIEFVGANAAEDIDNGVTVSPTGFSGSSQLCPLRTSASATMQERGTRATIAGNRLTLAFNPSMGFATTTSSSFSCMVPASLNSVTYGNLNSVIVRPVGDQSRKRPLGELVAAFQSNAGTGSTVAVGSLTCGTRTTSF